MSTLSTTLSTGHRASAASEQAPSVKVRAAAERKWVQLPLAIILLLVTLLVALGIAVPLAVISFRASDKTSLQLSDLLRGVLVDGVAQKVISMMNNCATSLNMMANTQSINTVLAQYQTDRTVRFASNRDVAFDLLSLGTTLGLPSTSLYLVASGMELEGYTVVPAGEYSWGQYYLVNSTDPTWVDDTWGSLVLNRTSVKPSVTFIPWGPPFPVPAQFMYAGVLKPVWTPTAWLPFGNFSIGGRSCYATRWTNSPMPTVADNTFDVVYMSTLEFNSVSGFLYTQNITKNAVISVLETNGQMIASSMPFLFYNSAYSGSVLATQCNDTMTASAAQYVVDTYGDWNLPTNISTIIKTSIGNVMLDVRLITDNLNSSLILLVAIPEDDILAEEKKGRRVAIGVTIGVAVTVVIIAGAASFVIVVPLSNLIWAMDQAKNFDFTPLRNGYLNRRSGIREVAKLQEVFAVMMANFASGS